MKEIILTKGLVAQVDDEDYDWLNNWSWHAEKRAFGLYYAVGSYGVLMHRLINDTPDDMLCHHKDENGVNNQKSNLINMTIPQHKALHTNLTRLIKPTIGISWHKRQKCFMAYTRVNGKQVHLGRFATMEDAKEAVNNNTTIQQI